MAVKPVIKINKPGHIVVLDQSWHKLFEGNKTIRISQLERKLNKLLKEQGKVNTEYVSYKQLKKQMMDEIVANMGKESAGNKMQQNSRHIKEINRKFDQYEEKKSQLPAEIESVNNELLTESMIQLYKKMIASKEKDQKVKETIATLKSQLKEKVGEKEDLEQEINELYGYMHDIAGFEVIEQLDKYYFGED